MASAFGALLLALFARQFSIFSVFQSVGKIEFGSGHNRNLWAFVRIVLILPFQFKRGLYFRLSFSRLMKIALSLPRINRQSYKKLARMIQSDGREVLLRQVLRDTG